MVCVYTWRSSVIIVSVKFHAICGGYIDIFIEIYVMSSILKKCILKASAQSIRILWIFS